MDILFLGTSAGAPSRQRNVTGLALMAEQGSNWYLVDCGESTQHQILNTRLSIHDLQAVFITHVHGDHCYGLPGLLSSAAMHGRKTPLHIIAPAAIEGWLQLTQQMSEAFLTFDIHFTAVEQLHAGQEAGQRCWQDAAVMVDTTLLSHRVPSYAYRFTENQSEPVLDSARLQAAGVPPGPLWGQLKRGLDIVHEGQTFVASEYLHHPHAPRCIIVGGDNDQPELLRQACQTAQVLVHEATYTVDVAERVGARAKHSSAADVAAFAASVSLPNLVLTHFSARYQADPERTPSISDIETEAQAHYHGNLFLAEDFARLRLSKSGELSRVV